jgi:hypothetical protein
MIRWRHRRVLCPSEEGENVGGARHPWRRYLFGQPVPRWEVLLAVPGALRRSYDSHRHRHRQSRLRAARSAWRIIAAWRVFTHWPGRNPEPPSNDFWNSRV